MMQLWRFFYISYLFVEILIVFLHSSESSDHYFEFFIWKMTYLYFI